MKKIIFMILVVLCFALPSKVEAALSTNIHCDGHTTDEQRKIVQKCYIDITVSGDTSFYAASGELILTNTTLKGNVVSGDQRIKITDNSLSNLTFVSETAIKNETVRLAEFTLYVATNGRECKCDWKPSPNYGLNYSCINVNGYYYDKSGNSVSKEEYEKQCTTPEKIICEVAGGKYYGKNGTVVSKDEYDVECGIPSCKIVNGVYYGKNGGAVSDVEYDKQCNAHYCKIIDGTYFGKNGNEILKADYDVECPSPNPTTSEGLTIWYVVLTLLFSFLITIVIYVKRNKKVYKI